MKSMICPHRSDSIGADNRIKPYTVTDVVKQKSFALMYIDFRHLLLPMVSVVLLLSACQSTLEGVRKVTYPPDFNYISRDKLNDTMQQFALYTSLLERGLQNAPQVSAEQRRSAISILGKMEQLSLKLGTETLTSNHDMVSHNIDRFRQRIIDARLALQQQPPNYYKAGAVAAYCLNCHALGPDR